MAVRPAEHNSYLLGIDLGTSTAKVALFSLQGELVGFESDEYLLMPEGDRAEADPELYWQTVVRAIRRLLSKFPGKPERIAAVSTSTFGESVFLLGANGQPTRPSISWMDSRSQAEASAMLEAFGPQRLLEASGQADISAVWPATKFRWMATHEPETLRDTAHLLLPDDYLLFRLSGEYVAEHTMWGSSLVMDIRQKAWAPDLLEWSGLRERQLSRLVPAGTAIGHISRQCAEETGLSPRTVVVAGAMDQMCAAVGAGNIAPGIITESTGTVLAMLVTIPAPIFNAEAKVPCHIHAIPGAYCLLPWSTTGGVDLKWFKDRFGESEKQRAANEGVDAYDLLTADAEKVPPGCEGLVMLPHLEGALFPEFNPAARGVFFGIGLKHTKAHFTRAILEAIAYMIRRDLEILATLGAGAAEIRVLGGGAKSRLWSQIKADVCGLPIIIPAHQEAAALGAAMLAAVGAGLHADFPSAVQAMARPGTRLLPQSEFRAVYDQGYHLYVSLYDQVKDLFTGR